MKNALILHGTDFDKTNDGNTRNWFPWLKQQLEQLDFDVSLPLLPEAWHPDFDRYWQVLKDFDYNPDTLLVGHSSGPPVIFNILQTLKSRQKIKLAVSVAGFYQDEGWGCEGIFKKPFDWPKIRSMAQKHIVIWSQDDPYVKKFQTDYISEKLKVKPIIYQSKGHISAGSNPPILEFPELLEIIKQEYALS